MVFACQLHLFGMGLTNPCFICIFIRIIAFQLHDVNYVGATLNQLLCELVIILVSSAFFKYKR